MVVMITLAQSFKTLNRTILDKETCSNTALFVDGTRFSRHPERPKPDWSSDLGKSKYSYEPKWANEFLAT